MAAVISISVRTPRPITTAMTHCSPSNGRSLPARRRQNTRFFAKGGFYHADGKARFIAVEPPICDRTNPDYPLTLNTGRIRDQWHTMTRTGKSARLSSHIAEPFAELHPRDAMEIGVGNAALSRSRALTANRSSAP
jgi:assimilatory nitrate reductase catalytic subunit